MKTLVVCSLVLLGACSSYTSDETPTDKAVAMCTTYGFKPGTDGFSGCLQTEIQRQHAAIANMWQGAEEYTRSLQPRVCNTTSIGSICY